MPENKIREYQALANELSFLVGCGGGGWPGEVSDAQRQSRSASMNCRARVNHHTPRSGHIALGIRHVHISSEAVLVSIEGRGEGAFSSSSQFCRGILFAKCGLEIRPGLPHFANDRIT